ncbi:IclR family transcriptional regulator, partial [Lactobacillus crispatus]
MKGSAERDDDDARGGVTAVSRALMVLEAFGVNDADLPLAEISRRTGIHKTTVLRLARTLAAHNYRVQKEDGNWRLGREAGWLGACYQATFNVQEVVEPVLRELSRKTGESASFYVREGDERACLLRVE